MTQALWITHEMVSVAHLRALVNELDAANALDMAQVTIYALGDQSAIQLPNGQTFTREEIPAQGILILPE